MNYAIYTKAFIVLAFVTVIFVLFSSCILLGNQTCLSVDVADTHNRPILIVSSVIIISLCAWVWYKIVKDPKLETSSGKPVATIIIVFSVIVGLLIIFFATSSFWAPLFGR